jgi:hypothetical protein
MLMWVRGSMGAEDRQGRWELVQGSWWLVQGLLERLEPEEWVVGSGGC